MSETSACWNGTTVGDAATYAAAYCADEIARYQRGMACVANRGGEIAQGPIYTFEGAYNGQLEVTHVAGLTVQINTGRAFVNGWIYESDSTVQLTATVDAYYKVILYMDETNQLIRVNLIWNAVSSPSLVPYQIDGTSWAISLASFQVSGGAITGAGITDERNFLNAGTLNMFLPAYTGLETTTVPDQEFQRGSVNPATTTGQPIYGVRTPDTLASNVVVAFAVPSDFISNLVCRFLVVSGATSNLNAYIGANYGYGANGEDPNTHNNNVALSVVPLQGSLVQFYYEEVVQSTLSSAAIGDYVFAQFLRDASNVLDTIGTVVYVQGLIVEYLGFTR